MDIFIKVFSSYTNSTFEIKFLIFVKVLKSPIAPKFIYPFPSSSLEILFLSFNTFNSKSVRILQSILNKTTLLNSLLSSAKTKLDFEESSKFKIATKIGFICDPLFK